MIRQSKSIGHIVQARYQAAHAIKAVRLAIINLSRARDQLTEADHILGLYGYRRVLDNVGRN